MDKINQEKLVNYSNSATKGAAIGGAAGAVFSSGLAIKNFLDDKKFSKMVMESPPDIFEKIAKKGIISFNQEAAEKNGELLKAGLKLDEAKKQLINLHKKLSKSTYGNLALLCASCAGVGAGIGVIVQYLKNKAKEN